MKLGARWIAGVIVILAFAVNGLLDLITPSGAVAKVEGRFEKLNEPSTHSPGKVQLTEFADFYCPHCHMFDQSAIPMLEEEFGNELEVTMVGFPVIRGMLPTPFLMYEQARMMGKGPEMKKVLFRTIHRDRVIILDRTVREMLVKEVGLDPVAFEAGLASGKPSIAFEKGKRWGERIKVNSTPTVLLDGNIKIEGEAMTSDNIKTVIRSIISSDSRK